MRAQFSTDSTSTARVLLDNREVSHVESENTVGEDEGEAGKPKIALRYGSAPYLNSYTLMDLAKICQIS